MVLVALICKMDMSMTKAMLISNLSQLLAIDFLEKSNPFHGTV